MRTKILTAAIFGVLLYSCAPKVVVSAQKPDPVQVPPQLPSMVVTMSKPDNLASGKTLYENNCSKCHKLFAPNDFSKQDWAPILVRMQKKANVDDNVMAEVSSYIYSHL